MDRAVIYARYSSDLQNETSIDDQIRICKERIDQEGWILGQDYCDYAVSGASMQRDALKQLMEDAAAGAFDIVVTEGLDRMSRDSEHMPGIYKRLTYHGVRIYSLTDGGFVSDMHIAFGGAKNAMFLKDLSFKVKRGISGKVAKGRAITKAPYGYDIVRRFDTQGQPVRGERSINEAEAATVRRIFTLYNQGQSARKIAKTFNHEGIPSPSGKEWHATSINGNRHKGSGILNNELYIGRVVWNRLSYHKDPDTERRTRRDNDQKDWVVGEAPHLRIIDQALWDQVKARQEQLAQKQTPQDKRRPPHLLSYLLKCGACGGGFTIVGRGYYSCYQSRNKGICTNRKTIHKDKLHNAVLDALETQLLNHDLLQHFSEAYNAHLHHICEAQQGHIKQAEHQLKKLDTEKAKLIEAIKAGIPAESLKEEFTRNTQQREHLLNSIEQRRQLPKQQIFKPDMTERYHAAIAMMKHSISGDKTSNDIYSDDERSEGIDLIRRLVDKVVLTPNSRKQKLDVCLHGDLANLLTMESDLPLAAKPLNYSPNHGAKDCTCTNRSH